MSMLHEHTPTAPLSEPPARYQPCEQCGGLLDEPQRYCLSCGTRRKHAEDPAARFLAAATRRRQPITTSAPGPAPERGRSASLLTAAAITAVPLALGLGVLIGRSAAGGDGKLIAALRATRAPVIQYSGSAGPSSSGSAASTSGAAPVTTLTLARGYAVELGSLPAGTTQAAAAHAEHADEAKGATGVGVIAPHDYTISPAASAGDYVIYAAASSSRGAAQSALRKLHRSFPQAKLIAVRATGSSAAGAGKVVTRTRYGAAHQITGYKPSAAGLSQGAAVAKQDSRSTGKAASGAGLPDVVAVP